MNKNLIQLISDVSVTLEKAPDDKKPAITMSLLMLVNKMIKTLGNFQDIPKTYMGKMRPAISAQLKAAEKRTEIAADKFLSIGEEISAISNALPDISKKQIQAKINALFEASSFQDLVAQHLNEIKLLVDDLTYDIESMSFALKELTEDSNTEELQRSVKMRRSDEHLLNGPATDF